MIRTSRALGVIAVTLVMAAPAQAETELTIGAGGAVLPDYQGSDHYRAIPLPYIRLDTDWISIRNNKLGLEADVVPWKALEAGPILRYDGGRDDDTSDAQVNLLPEIGGAIEAGGFLGGGLPLSFLGVESEAILLAKVSFVQGLEGGHEGGLAEGSVGLFAPLGPDFKVIVNATTSYMTNDYAESYFGVSAAGAAASGLAAYDAESGFRDVGTTVIGIYDITEEISALGIASYSRLIGDAADSPIVRDTGSADQFFIGLGLAYTFR